MARSIWTGAIAFGLVNIPVGLYTSTTDRSVRFNQFQAGTADRIRYRRVNERTGEEVDGAEIVRGYDLGGGEYVVLTDDELEAAAPDKSRAIEIADFVDQAEIDPVHYRSSYYLAPRDASAARSYALLRRAMGEAGKVGIATFVLRGKEHLVAVRPDHRVLALETMFFADEVRDPVEELPNLPDEEDVSERELSTAMLLIDSMARPWSPGDYHDTYRERVEALVERKRRGEEVVTEAAPPRSAKVVDLMEALQASVEEARGRTAPAGRQPVRAANGTRRRAAGAGTKKAKPRSKDAAKPRRKAG